MVARARAAARGGTVVGVHRSRRHDDFAAFVEHAEAHLDDPHAVADGLARLLAHDGWLAPEHQLPGVDTYRQHLLHVSPTRRLSVVALVWLPGQYTPIHDHVSWCVVGVLRGVEREIRYRLVRAGGRDHPPPVGSVLPTPGPLQAPVPPAPGIHPGAPAGGE